MNWKRVSVDGPPPCDGETVFVGVNSAGYCGCFNAVTEPHNRCWYETAESGDCIMSELEWWKPLEMPGVI